MAIKQRDGSPATPRSTVNNGGSMAGKGTSSVLDTVSNTPRSVGVFGSTVVQGNEVNKILSAGEFAHNHNAPITKRVTTELAGLSSDALQTTGGNPEGIKSIHKVVNFDTVLRTTAIREGKFDIYSGEFDAGYPASTGTAFGVDDAANPTRDDPGQLTYRTGSPTATTSNYSKKNS